MDGNIVPDVEQVRQRYLTIASDVDAMCSSLKLSGNVMHFVNNMLGSAHLDLLVVEQAADMSDPVERIRSAQMQLSALGTYMDLIKTYPDFRAVEGESGGMNHPRRYFADLQGLDRTEYIRLANERLASGVYSTGDDLRARAAAPGHVGLLPEQVMHSAQTYAP